MEKTVTCPECNGEMKICPQCEGYGCRWCNGHGKLHVKCNRCNSTGKVVEVEI